MVYKHGYTDGCPPSREKTMNVRPIFAWYDLWIGAFWDQKNRRLYILPIPCLGIVIQFAGQTR